MISLSYLYVPADDAERLAKARARGAHALIVDLEDGVAASAKASARQTAADFVSQSDEQPGPVVWVRINRGDLERWDLESVLEHRPGGIAIPKVESADEARELVARIHQRQPGLAIMVLIESAAGVLAMPQIAAVPGVSLLQVGEADLRADIGVELGPDESELSWVRQQAVLACAAASIAPPVGPVSVDFRDLDAFLRSTRSLARMGYLGRACIHPAQVPVVHQAFEPSAAAVQRAQELCALADAHAAEGRGAFTGPDGRLVDEPIIRQARRLLHVAEMLQPGD